MGEAERPEASSASFRRLSLIAAVSLVWSLAPSALADLRYETRIAGVEDSDLADLLDKVSSLKTLEDRRPASVEMLRRRADDDLPRLTEAAHSLGYWDAHFSYTLDTAGDTAKVTVAAAPGPLYRVASITLTDAAGRPLAVPLDPDTPPPLKPGDAARSAAVVAEETALLAAIAGLKRLDPGYVERRVKWRPGEVFDNRKVDETRDALTASGLFSTVKITPAADPADPGRVRMTIDATERAPRTIGAGLGYNTSEGAGARVFWENRNLFGNAEYLRLSLAAGQQQNALSANFRRPDFLAVDQDLLASARIADETPVAYHSRRAELGLGLERRFGRDLTASAGLAVEKANVIAQAISGSLTASQRTQHYALVGVPLGVKLDKSDNLLNPTRGYRIQGSVVPYTSFSGPSLTFVSGRVTGSVYRRLGATDRYVLAASAALASIAGASLAALPADKRLYAGGGGSVRAYGYQMAGPLDLNNNPIGGRSSAELSLELRIKITDTIGVVPFVDAGSVYPSSLPQFGHRLLWGPGLGLRYYTPFGPVRLDVATPAVRRRGDSAVQLYISLGQAF